MIELLPALLPERVALALVGAFLLLIGVVLLATGRPWHGLLLMAATIAATVAMGWHLSRSEGREA